MIRSRYHIGIGPRLGLVLAAIVLAATASTLAQMPPLDEGQKDTRRLASVSSPAHCLAAHRIGRIELAVANNGTFGREYHPGATVDFFTGEEILHSCQYPKKSNIAYLFGGTFWVGAVVGSDTLVSTGADGWQQTYEMFPDVPPLGSMVHRSIKDPTSPNYVDAISEEDYIAVYTDTLTEGIPSDYFGRPHMPLNIEVTQASYAWSYEYAEDFVLFDYQIRNIGTRALNEVYMAILVDCMICFDCLGDMWGFQDDHSGFLHTYPDSCATCEYEDTVFIAWATDDNGDPDLVYHDGRTHPCPAVTGTRIIRTPSDSLDVSFNWWIGNGNAALDFGPREKPFVGRLKEDYRDYRTGGLGTPEGDVNKYYVMRNQEFDYNQVMTGVIGPSDSLWLYPKQALADSFAMGYDTRYLLSFGPFTIHPGQTLPISFAYVAGDSIHRVYDNQLNLPNDPYTYLSNLDFSDLATNSRWAANVYDNPGYDTDGDGYRGRFSTCVLESTLTDVDTVIDGQDTTITQVEYTAVDTCWMQGDDVPDFRGASPPPAPPYWLETTRGAVTVRFNGAMSETARDVFSGDQDFEGYRIYVSRDEREESYCLVASYDIEDYDKYVYFPDRNPTPGFERRDRPLTTRELRCLYGIADDPCLDSAFDPLRFTTRSPYRHPQYPDSVFYFAPHDFNTSRLGDNTPIRKSYPDQTYPSNLDPAQADPGELTDDGWLKYFEYEFTIDDLLPHVSWWLSVTAFDYGSPESGLAALETSVTDNATMFYALPDDEAVKRERLEVYVYPNPYRIDADLRGQGYEGRVREDRPVDRTRALHFANLPSPCTISIYTLDGDLVRRIEHDGGTHDTWNLITRNTQLVVSGLYYWTVEAADGQTQIGKVAIIM